MPPHGAFKTNPSGFRDFENCRKPMTAAKTDPIPQTSYYLRNFNE